MPTTGTAGSRDLLSRVAGARPPRGPPLDRHRFAIGTALVLASGLCFGSMPIFARVAYASGVDAPTLLLLRFTIASALLWGLFFWRRAQLPDRRSLVLLVAMGSVGYAGQAFSYFTALTLASAGLVALLLYLYPALVVVLARLLFGHLLTKRQLASLALALLGTALTVGQAGRGTSAGVLFSLLAALTGAAYILAGSRLPKTVSATASTPVVITSAALVFGVVGALRGLCLPANASGWGAILAIALVCTVVAMGFFLAGLERVGPVKASIYSTTEPACTVALAALFLGEKVTWSRVLGGALILAAVILLARASSVPPQAESGSV
jgi:drug/metabolite transporter (DMT)-like permease